MKKVKIYFESVSEKSEIAEFIIRSIKRRGDFVRIKFLQFEVNRELIVRIFKSKTSFYDIAIINRVVKILF